MTSSRFATLDIGTNSVLLLIVEQREGELVPILERATITRLGEGVGRTHELAAGAKERTLACIRSYADEIARVGVTRVAAVGTSALRDARGGQEFTREIEHVLGVPPSVIDGGREAELTFRGALSGLAVRGDVTVFDVGGGSTEIVTGTRDGARSSLGAAVSLDIGSVRLHERHLATDPPARHELAAVVKDIDAALTAAPRPVPGATLVGVAGTVTTLASLSLELGDYDPALVHGHELTHDRVVKLTDKLASLPLSERRQLRGLDPRRADVIVAGSLIVERVMSFAARDVLVVSDRGVRFGLAEELAATNPS
jgi:exopolyphosphatase/guanosine-5'-triphosphate,3'-diphosphate pyrophosphatase